MVKASLKFALDTEIKAPEKVAESLSAISAESLSAISEVDRVVVFGSRVSLKQAC